MSSKSVKKMCAVCVHKLIDFSNYWKNLLIYVHKRHNIFEKNPT